MPFPVAPGTPSYSGTYIPQVYATKLLTKFYARTVFGAIANTDYEGEIKKAGDKVNIRNLPDIAIKDYVKGKNLDFQQPEPANTSLDIDKGKYWAFVIDSVDAAQFDIDAADKWAGDASQQMKIAIDRGILAAIYALPAAANKGATAGAESASVNLGVTGTPLAVTKSTILDTIIGSGQVLDEQNVVDEDRWIVIPPLLSAMIKLSDLKDVSVSGDGVSPLRNGRLGMIDRYTIYVSNLLTKTTDTGHACFECVFGHKAALTFASQLVENDSMKNPNGFGMLYKGLQVYGYKVVNPSFMGAMHVYKGT